MTHALKLTWHKDLPSADFSHPSGTPTRVTTARTSGAVLVFVFGLAPGVPLVLAGAVTGAVKQMRRAAGWMPIVERSGGYLLLLAALYFVYQTAAYAGFVTPFQFLFG